MTAPSPPDVATAGDADQLEIYEDFGEALLKALTGRGVNVLYLGETCPVCGWPLRLAGGTGVSTVVREMLEQHPQLDMERDPEWLDAPLRAYLYCVGPTCTASVPVEFSSDGVEAVR